MALLPREGLLRSDANRPWRAGQAISFADDGRCARRHAIHNTGTQAHAGIELQHAGTGTPGKACTGVGDRELKHQAIDGTEEHVDLAAAALHLTEVGGELFTAARQVHVLLDVLPVYQEQAGVNLQAMIEKGVLAAELVAPKTVGQY